MPLDLPPTAKAFARSVVVFLDTAPAASDGIPTLTEVNAALFASLHIYTPFNVVPSQNTGEGPRKHGAKSVPTENGLVTWPAAEVQYSYKPQLLGTSGAEGNEVYELLVPSSQVTTVVFDDLAGDLDTIPADAVGHVYLMEPGVRQRGRTGDGEFDHFSTTQNLIVVGGEPVAEDHVFAGA